MKKKQKNLARIISIILVVALCSTFIISIVPLQKMVNLTQQENNMTTNITDNIVVDTTETTTTETENVENNGSTTEQGEEETLVENEENISIEELKSESKTAIIKLTNGEQIKLALYPKIAPISVENFINLANEHFYDGIIFHRVIEDFMIQTGDPTGTGTGGSETNIKGEFASNGVKNPLSHKKGVVSMARAMDKDSASSQFFITVADSLHLDGEYAAFGEVVEGQEVADKISLVETNEMDKPLEDIKIETIIIE